MHRALHVDPEHQHCTGRAHDEDVEAGQHAEPWVDLEERTSSKNGLGSIEERTHVSGVCRTLAVLCEC